MRSTVYPIKFSHVPFCSLFGDKKHQFGLRMHPILNVSFPRSGHHLLASDILPEVLGPEIKYCEYYNHCQTIPCTDPATNYQKVHDFNLAEAKVDLGRKHIIQYRHPYESISSWFTFRINSEQSLDSSQQAWKTFLEAGLDYWLGFIQKWVIDTQEIGTTNFLYIPYHQLVGETEKTVDQVVEFMGCDQRDYKLSFKPMQRRAIESFSHYSVEELRQVEQQCRGFMERLEIPSLLMDESNRNKLESTKNTAATPQELLEEIERLTRHNEALTVKLVRAEGQLHALDDGRFNNVAQAEATAVQTVSVVTVTYNTADTIQSTLDSVKEQTLGNVQHIVIDGGSTDGTAEIVAQANIDTFVSEPDNGIYDAMTKGKALITGDVAIFLNAGDIFADTEVCRDVVAYFNETQSDVVFGNFMPYLIAADDTFDHHFEPGKVYDTAWVRNRTVLAKVNIHHQALFYSREVLNRCSYFSEEWPDGSDWEFNVQALVQHRFRAHHMPRLVAKFALGGESTSDYEQQTQMIQRLGDIIRHKYFSPMPEVVEDEFVFAAAPSTEPPAVATAPAASPIAPPTRSVPRRIADLLRRARGRLPYVRSQQAIWKQLTALTAQTAQTAQASKTDAGVVQIRKQITDLNQQLLTRINGLEAEQRAQYAALSKRQDDVLGNLARLLSPPPNAAADKASDHGYRVFSQFNEDGIIQFLTQRVELPNQRFIEFGVEDYRESNTRFLMMHNNWRGLVIDSSEAHVQAIRNSDYFWRHDLEAQCAFVDRDNINSLFEEAGFSGDIGLLSIDVDGIDYWLWEACTAVTPRIVVIEYNAIFGPTSTVTVPYDARFDRAEKHYSHLYAGASLAALVTLGKLKGYSLVASNDAGNNAFFVRNKYLGDLPVLSAAEAYVKACFREARGAGGQPLNQTIDKSVRLIRHLPVVDVVSGDTRTIGELELNYD